MHDFHQIRIVIKLFFLHPIPKYWLIHLVPPLKNFLSSHRKSCLSHASRLISVRRRNILLWRAVRAMSRIREREKYARPQKKTRRRRATDRRARFLQLCDGMTSVSIVRAAEIVRYCSESYTDGKARLWGIFWFWNFCSKVGWKLLWKRLLEWESLVLKFKVCIY